jgi:hypothetical protein
MKRSNIMQYSLKKLICKFITLLSTTSTAVGGLPELFRACHRSVLAVSAKPVLLSSAVLCPAALYPTVLLLDIVLMYNTVKTRNFSPVAMLHHH